MVEKDDVEGEKENGRRMANGVLPVDDNGVGSTIAFTLLLSRNHVGGGPEMQMVDDPAVRDEINVESAGVTGTTIAADVFEPYDLRLVDADVQGTVSERWGVGFKRRSARGVPWKVRDNERRGGRQRADCSKGNCA